MDLGLKGQVVLVTGGVRGVGAGISAVLADFGATVVACARRPAEAADPRIDFVGCDIRDADDGFIADGFAVRSRLDRLVH